MFGHALQRVGCVGWTHPQGSRFYGLEPPSVASDPPTGGGDCELGSAHRGRVCRLGPPEVLRASARASIRRSPPSVCCSWF